MKRTMRDPTTRRHDIDPLDTDLLAALEERDRRLYAILNKATRYRNLLSDQIKRLRAGDAPELVRAMLARWDTILREVKRLAADL